MGHTNWDQQTYSTRSAKMHTQTREEVFTSTGLKDYMDPAKITVRESRDSEAHPKSTALIFGFDETGSMGGIPEVFVKTSLGKMMTGIFDASPISDPHIMVLGIGDAHADHAPLQCSQFETDIRIAEQLTDIYLEGNGGGNDQE